MHIDTAQSPYEGDVPRATGASAMENASSRSVTLRDFGTSTDQGLYRNELPRNGQPLGPLFLENFGSHGTPAAQFYLRHPQQMWARQLNLEHGDADRPFVFNNGGVVWILGMKHENINTFVETRNGGQTELLGGLNICYRDPKLPPLNHLVPALINDESRVSAVFTAYSYTELPYVTWVRETQNGVVRELRETQLTGRGNGRVVPLYVGGATIAKPAAKPTATKRTAQVAASKSR